MFLPKFQHIRSTSLAYSISLSFKKPFRADSINRIKRQKLNFSISVVLFWEIICHFWILSILNCQFILAILPNIIHSSLVTIYIQEKQIYWISFQLDALFLQFVFFLLTEFFRRRILCGKLANEISFFIVYFYIDIVYL